MSNRMLIDAAHPEETRVVVLRGNKVEEFDFEAAERQQLRGNIYLAKVTRVEPSLQAAFVEYGGNRHGFLAFSEIHPDYYQIPYADRQALIEEQAREEAAEAAAEEPIAEEPEAAPAEEGAANGADEDIAGDAGSSAEIVSEANGAGAVEQVGAEDALEEVPQRPKARPRQYKIQEVIKRRQVLLVQVVKEERGTKGAALTTYLSLAGRYSVLMPNTARGGGISRKITNAADRKRLKSLAADLDVPEGMGVILRTAGANRTKTEIKRDFEYLLRLWENVRELTLKSTAPTLVYEEGSLVKRAIRDLYSREIDQVLVAGDEGYREAKDFMRMLMPSHAKNVQPYRDEVPIFMRFGVEPQLDAMFSPQVRLRSGGYIVLNQTEALVAIDVNSGRSTREHSIEDTALQTNLEAAEEVARQLRLRDLAGLIVIDFIDMEEKRNNRSVEKRLKDALRADRARIQLGRISHFGLLEMSRQRIRTGVLESSTEPCPVCHGIGQVRSVSSLALQILRAVEDQLLRSSTHHLRVRTRPDTALYILNRKRAHLAQLESRFGLSITVLAETPNNGSAFTIERAEPVGEEEARRRAVALIDFAEEKAEERRPEERRTDEEDGRRRQRQRDGADERRAYDAARPVEDEPEEAAAPDDAEEDEEAVREGGAAEESAQSRKRRRRGRRGGRRRREPGENGVAAAEDAAEDGETAAAVTGLMTFADTDSGAPVEDAPVSDVEGAPAPADDLMSNDGLRLDDDVSSAEEPLPGLSQALSASRQASAEAAGDVSWTEAEAPAPRRAKPRADAAEDAARHQEPTAPQVEVYGEAIDVLSPDDRVGTEAAPFPAEERAPEDAQVSGQAGTRVAPLEDDNRPKRSGWWQRRSFF